MACILKTKKANLFGSPVKGFPVLIMEDNRVHWLSLNYFLDIYERLSLSSVALYAQHIQDLYSQIEVEENYNEVGDIDDSFLRAFKEDIAMRGGMRRESYTSHVIHSILLYCEWLECNGYCKNLIGDTKNHQIRVKYTDKGRIKHPLAKLSRNARCSAPRTNWIEIVKQYGPKGDAVHTRFELMIDWCRTVGLRANEVCSLKIFQLPSFDSVDKALLESRDLDCPLLITKGNKQDIARVPSLLLKRTWNYINVERKELLNSCSKSIPSDSEYIFISKLTRTKLNPTSFSNSVRKAYLSACINGELKETERVWTHGLRHNFAVTTIKVFDNSGIKRPESVARQFTRHSSEQALETYLLDRNNLDFI